MKYLKRSIIIFVLLDNFLTNLLKRVLFRTRWKLEGKCKMCGSCCQQIYLKISPRQLGSKLFAKLAIWWICWLFDFILLEVDYDHYYLIFTCKHLREDGKCGNYFWRPSVCRNYPLVDYFEEPKFLPGCGFHARLR